MGVLADYEDVLRRKGFGIVAGVDEVGRGPLAGPVVAAAVVVPQDAEVRAWLLEHANDSKLLNAKRREDIAGFVLRTCVVGVGEASVEEIDGLNIRNAAFLAMRRALSLTPQVQAVVVDGNVVISGWQGEQKAVVGGDGLELSVACASLVAKVHRDALMVRLAEEHPHYGWERNMGYSTAAHLEGLRVHGACVHHRRSFAPVKAVMELLERLGDAVAA